MQNAIKLTKFKKSRALTPNEVADFGAKLDDIRTRIMADLGSPDALYIRKVQRFVRYSEVGGRGMLLLGWLPPFWVAGAGLLSVSKIVENMELGHNVMHGQYDWLNDPEFKGDRYEWDNACDGDLWRNYHNYVHHTYTNIEDRDRDVGYGILRLFPTQKWTPAHLLQPLHAATLAVFFQWGVALHDLELEWAAAGKTSWRSVAKKLPKVARKAARQLGKDYVFFPLLAGPSFLPVFTGNLTANFVRNLWTFSIIFCGHFTEDAETFSEDVLAGETRGDWYLRQLHGSSNLTGGPLFHFFTGNLSHQIEHHLYPDMPANRYAEVAEAIRAVCDEYGQNYNTGSFRKQFGQVVKRIFRYSLPGDSRDSEKTNKPIGTRVPGEVYA